MAVYVIQEVPGRDLTPAMDFGTLEWLLPHGDTIISIEPTVARLRRKLQTFNDNDWLILIGDPVAIGLASAIAADMNGGYINLLKWDKRHKKYIPIKVNLNGSP